MTTIVYITPRIKYRISWIKTPRSWPAWWDTLIHDYTWIWAIITYPSPSHLQIRKVKKTKGNSPKSRSTGCKGETTQANSKVAIPNFAGFGFQAEDFKQSVAHVSPTWITKIATEKPPTQGWEDSFSCIFVSFELAKMAATSIAIKLHQKHFLGGADRRVKTETFKTSKKPSFLLKLPRRSDGPMVRIEKKNTNPMGNKKASKQLPSWPTHPLCGSKQLRLYQLSLCFGWASLNVGPWTTESCFVSYPSGEKNLRFQTNVSV